MYDGRHGGAYDRGAADAYYVRPFAPHLYEGGSYRSLRVEAVDMTTEELAAYNAGYADQVASGEFNEW